MSQVSFNSDLRLLRVGVLVIIRAAEQNRQRRNRTVVGNIDSELRQVGGSNAGFRPCRGRTTIDLSLRKERLENERGSK